MNMLGGHLRYLRYVLRHKWYVMVECFRLGLYWRGLTHDLSKFLPDEWFPYAKYFYGGKRGRTLAAQRAFDIAWLKHQKRNPHHWQHWILREDSGITKHLCIPPGYLGEMIADWRGMSRTFGRPRTEAWEWYQGKKDRMAIHPHSRRLLEMVLKREHSDFRPMLGYYYWAWGITPPGIKGIS